MLVLTRQTFVGLKLVGVERGACIDMLAHVVLNGVLLAVWDHSSAYCTVTLKDGGYNRLAIATTAMDAARLNVLVHIAGLAADKGFVALDFTPKLPAEVLILHSKANPMEHEPRGLLGDLDGAVEFPRGNPIPVAGNHPHGRKPLVQAERRILKNRAELDGELRLRVPGLALEHAAGSNETDILGAASRAYRNAIIPAVGGKVANAVVWIFEVNHCIQKGFWIWHLLWAVLNFAHTSTLAYGA